MSSVLIVLLHTFILCRSQIINYQCNFDTTPLTGDCQFTSTTGGPAMTAEIGPNAVATAPRQPLSDIKAILSPTMPNNEHCELPYPYPGFGGGWNMHFCRRFSNGTSACPTPSGPGRCDTGNYGLIKLPNVGGSTDHTYAANVEGSTNSVQCLDFYYYITDTTENARIEIRWENDEDTELITEVAAVASENKWQRKQVSFTGPPPLSSYEVMMRDRQVANFNFAFDEIYIYDGSCAGATTTIPSGSTPVPITTAAPFTTTTTTTTAAPIITTTTAAPITTTTTAALITTTTTIASISTITTAAPITTAVPITTAGLITTAALTTATAASSIATNPISSDTPTVQTSYMETTTAKTIPSKACSQITFTSHNYTNK
ncbi:unnamed protein product [Adineta steineri]|uniref:MAM domain-containing protein n=1 Tax=Adineta steineri TaxID=433720 RepID=A0A814VGX5_9BILA|nr:unnamed protein product [Adineta steineri]CAF3740432.1 unnamed protein product [Adineta steineri]